MKPISIALIATVLGLAACAPAPAPEPVTDQNYGGKYNASHTVSRGHLACPDWASFMYRGDMYCTDNN